jgi:hypothetical protein
MANITYITEQCGARWQVLSTGLGGDRAFWVLRVGGKSAAKPFIDGFYANSINAAAESLAN